MIKIKLNKNLRKYIPLAIFLLNFLVLQKAFALEQNTNYSHIKIGAQNFWSKYIGGTGLGTFPLNQQNILKAWQANHIDLSAGGANLNSYNPNSIGGGYTDSVHVYAYKLYLVRDIAETRGFIFEDMLWHSKVNYQVLSGWQWSGMDRFDAGETNSSGVYVNGIFLLEGSTYVDKTVAAYNVNVEDVAINDKIFIGSQDPFAEINFELSTVNSGKNVLAEYWNGITWAALSTNDNTNGLSQNGSITFIPPADWKKTIINGSRLKWWVRFTVSGNGVSPVASRIYGDNWLATDGSNNARGWDSSSETIVGTGELAYNPTPPVNATAKFRHQARITGMWAPNATFGNQSNIQNGQRSWGTYMGDDAKNNLAILNGGAYFFDDGNSEPAIVAPAGLKDETRTGLTGLYTDHSGVETAQEARITSYATAKNVIQETYPNVKVGSLSRTKLFADVGDWNINEDFSWVNNIASSTIFDAQNPANKSSTSFDGYLPINNPNNVVGITTFNDTLQTGFIDQAGSWAYWDKGNRSPILALATYYIGANENTYFSYNIGWTTYVYYASPGVYYYWHPTKTTTLTQELSKNLITDRYSIYGDFTNFPSPNSSDYPYTRIRIGNNIFKSYHKHSETELSLGDVTNGTKVYETAPIGTKVEFEVQDNQAFGVLPEGVEFGAWGMWFPAMGVDVGKPLENRNMNWKSWSDVGGENLASGNIWKREYEKALILVRPSKYNMTAAQVNTPSTPIDLNGTYYQLNANGTSGPGVTSISLRTGEGAILLKQPLIALNIYNFSNISNLISNWLKTGTVSDLNTDNLVNTRDLGIMMSKWN